MQYVIDILVICNWSDQMNGVGWKYKGAGDGNYEFLKTVLEYTSWVNVHIHTHHCCQVSSFKSLKLSVINSKTSSSVCCCLIKTSQPQCATRMKVRPLPQSLRTSHQVVNTPEGLAYKLSDICGRSDCITLKTEHRYHFFSKHVEQPSWCCPLRMNRVSGGLSRGTLFV